MAIAVVLLLLVHFRGHRMLQRFFFVASVGLLYLAHSITPTIACGVVVLAIPVLRKVCRLRIQERVVAYGVLASLAVVGSFAMTSYSTALLELVGKDSTLSGRAQLWSLVMDAIWKKPFLGYGYEAFWQGFRGESRGILESTGWLVPMAHNGYLDLWLSLGLAGLVVYALVFLKAIRLALRYLRYDRRTTGAWPIAYLLFFALHNTAESTLLTRTTFEFLMFVAVSVGLQQAELRERSTSAKSIEERGDAPLASLNLPSPTLGPREVSV